jgi:hypothetical protein
VGTEEERERERRGERGLTQTCAGGMKAAHTRSHLYVILYYIILYYIIIY